MSEIRSQATPARDELAGTIHAEICEESLEDCLDPDWRGKCARAADVLLADGWSKPRTVNNAAELDALKPGTVLRFPDGEIGMIMVTRDKRHVIGYPGILPTAELADASQHCFGDGITVLFTPGDAG
ncbi:hypothetical protein D4768_09805 [Rhodococcus erythropolis]|uniref:hypothetical protein n=1 Tax=Rhodococcus erythropolis TaxID=1833 RepID=UPI001F3AB623|nr:hypothetical protein [Rhodococcus erythropolis]UJC77962.1 hypothetical protein D4768_09805 [Rhodococcus erythropolis]